MTNYGYSKLENLPGFYAVHNGSQELGIAARRPQRKGQRGFWTFQPHGEDAWLKTFKTMSALCQAIETRKEG